MREVLHNAIAHADYTEEGRYLNVSVFSDHLMVDSPGKMPAPMTVNQLKDGVSQIRNRAIARNMHELGLIEEHGTAFAKAVAAEKDGYPIPDWSQPGQLVRVVLKPHPAALESAGEDSGQKRTRRDRSEDIFKIIEREGEVQAKAIAAELGITGRQVRTYLDRLERAGRIEATTDDKRDPNRAHRVRGGGS